MVRRRAYAERIEPSMGEVTSRVLRSLGVRRFLAAFLHEDQSGTQVPHSKIRPPALPSVDLHLFFLFSLVVLRQFRGDGRRRRGRVGLHLQRHLLLLSVHRQHQGVRPGHQGLPRLGRAALATATAADQRVYNFSAGPAVLPVPVLEQARDEMLCLPGVGASILEISHRSAAFTAIIEAAEANIRKLLGVPEDYAVLFLQGGGRLQFWMTAANLIALDHPDASGVYNVGGGKATTVLEFARLMCKEFPSATEPAVTGEFRVGDTRHTVSDIRRLGLLGWVPRYSVEDNVRQYLDWFREQPVDGEWLASADAEMARSQVVRRTSR